MFNKSKSKRNYRSRKQEETSNDDEKSEETKREENEDKGEEEESVLTSLQERKELQSFRKRQTGVSAESLLVGEKIEPKKEADVSDPFKIKSGGGLTEMSTTKKVTQVSELGTAFSTETNQRDEDVQLLKYIEEGLKKKRGADETSSNNEKKYVVLCFHVVVY